MDETAGPSTTDGAGHPVVSAPVSRRARAALRLVLTLVLMIGVAFALRQFVVAPYYVPSQSMEPTLHGCPGCDDDHVLVEKLSYDFHDVEHGDIVVFHRPTIGGWPSVPDAVLIKRVIGVAGDVISVQGGHLYRNGAEVDEPYVNPTCRVGTTWRPLDTRYDRHTFTRVPPGELFLMGDNRCDSDDSRLNGVVPSRDVIGRAFMIVWPVERISSL